VIVSVNVVFVVFVDIMVVLLADMATVWICLNAFEVTLSRVFEVTPSRVFEVTQSTAFTGRPSGVFAIGVLTEWACPAEFGISTITLTTFPIIATDTIIVADLRAPKGQQFLVDNHFVRN
jgi:hypothetical protein